MVKTVGGTTTDNVSYLYDIDGLRTAKNDDGVTTNYVVDKNRDYAQVLNELDSTNTPTVSYVYGDDLIKQTRAANDSYFLYDGLGSTRALTGATGAITDTYDYNAYGTEIDSTGVTENSYRYTGEQFDSESGNYYLRARYLNPTAGRFLTQDTWMGNSQNPITLNKYVYGNSDPVNWIDPTGNFGLASFSVGNNIRGILSTISVPTYSSAIGKVAAGLIGAGLAGSLINNPLLQYMNAPTLVRNLERFRARVESKVTRRARGRRVLFHYTTRAGAIAITACQCLRATVFRGATTDGLPRPRGGYATSIPPWSATATQTTIAQTYYGGTTSRVGRLGWYVAIDGSDFFPYGAPGEYVKSVSHPLQPLVSIRTITIGPNPMKLF